MGGGAGLEHRRNRSAEAAPAQQARKRVPALAEHDRVDHHGTRRSGRDILAHGGVGFAQSLVATGLIDEYHLMIHPVVLGQGRNPFSLACWAVRLQLIDSTVFKTGAAAHSYRPC